MNCPNCDSSVMPIFNADGTYQCQECRQFYRLTIHTTMLSESPAAAPTCPTCEATRREMAELRARIGRIIDKYEILDRHAGYGEAARLFAEMRDELRALLPQPGRKGRV